MVWRKTVSFGPLALLLFAAVDGSVAYGRQTGPDQASVKPGLAVSTAGEQTREFESRLRIARAEREFAATRDAAAELVRLAAEVATHTSKTGDLSSGDRKTLDRIKKLAKRLRTDMGGWGDPQMAETPKTARDAASAIGAAAKAIEKEMAKSTRYEMNSRVVTLAGDLMILCDVLKALGGSR